MPKKGELILPNKPTDDENKTIPFQTIIGGKDDTRNWLNDLPVGSVFLIADKHQPRQFSLGEFCIYHRRPKSGATKLYSNLNQPEVWSWVKPSSFVLMYDLIEVIRLGWGDERDLEESLDEENSTERDRTDTTD